MTGKMAQTISFHSRVVVSARHSKQPQQKPWVLLTSKSDHHTIFFKSNPAAVQIYEARFDLDGSQKVSVSFALGSTHWKAMAFEECPEKSGNFFLVLKPGIASSNTLPCVSKALTRYEKTGCLWDFMDAVDGHLSIGIPDVSKITGWNIEHAKKCVNFLGNKSERTSTNDKLKGIQEKHAEARSTLLEVIRTLKTEEESAEVAKRRLTYSNVSFNAVPSKFNGDWNEWDKKMTEVFNLKKKKAKAETYIRLCDEQLKMEDINLEKLLGYDELMINLVRCERDGVISSGLRYVMEDSGKGSHRAKSRVNAEALEERLQV